MSKTCAEAAGDQSLPVLTKVFPPGRLVQLQLSPEAIGSGGRLASQVRAKFIPNWITWGVVLETTKVVNVVMVRLRWIKSFVLHSKDCYVICIWLIFLFYLLTFVDIDVSF